MSDRPFVNNNPFTSATAFSWTMLKPPGIEKASRFQPDARLRAILEDAARIGDAIDRPKYLCL